MSKKRKKKKWRDGGVHFGTKGCEDIPLPTVNFDCDCPHITATEKVFDVNELAEIINKRLNTTYGFWWTYKLKMLNREYRVCFN